MERLPFQFKKRPHWEFLCPICKKERRSFYWPAPQPRHYRQLTACGLFLAISLWPLFGEKAVFLLFPLWALFELIYRSRARQSLICPYCNFDPYLFKRDPKLARQKVASFFSDRKKTAEETRQKKNPTNSPPA